MKRYGLSMALVLLIVISIGTFYIRAETSQHPEFGIIKQQGDESEIVGVSLRGSYTYMDYRFSEAVTVDSFGSEHMDSRPSLSFFLNASSYWYDAKVKQLISEHRQFMRGKQDANGIYEDDQLVVYIEVNSDDPFSGGNRKFYFEVSVLDKKQNKNWSYKVNVPNKQLEYQINVQDVQVYEDEIVVVTSNYLNTIGSEYHRYSLDLKSDRVPEDQLIVLPQTKRVVNESSGIVVDYNLQIVNGTNITQPNQYSVFYATQTHSSMKDTNSYIDVELGINATQVAKQLSVQESRKEIIGVQIVIYDLETGLEVSSDNQQFVDFVTKQTKTDFMNLNMDGDNLFITKQSEQGITVMEYNLIEAEVTIHDIQLEHPKVDVAVEVIKNKRLYLLTEDYTNNRKPTIIVVDLNSDKTVYQGTIGLKESERNEAEELNNLHFYTMELK